VGQRRAIDFDAEFKIDIRAASATARCARTSTPCVS